MKVRITYKAHLIGSTAINYNPTYKGHHFWSLDLPSVMNSAGINNSLTFTEDIEIGYFANAEVELKNNSGQVVSAVKAVAAPMEELQPA